MSGALIRAFRQADVPALTEVTNCPGVRAGTLRLPFTSEANVQQRFQDGPNSYSLVAEKNGAAVGWGTLVRGVARTAHKGTVVSLAVHDDHQRQGIGRALMGALLDLADNWLGLVRVQLEVFADNHHAIRLYESLAFEREGLLRADALRDGRLVDSCLMARLREAPAREARFA